MQRAATADEAMFHALVASSDRRDLSRRPTGIAAVAKRIIGDIATGAVEVIVTDASARGLGIRSPIPLEAGAVYQITAITHSLGYARIVRSRARRDGAFDVGAVRIAHPDRLPSRAA